MGQTPPTFDPSLVGWADDEAVGPLATLRTTPEPGDEVETDSLPAFDPVALRLGETLGQGGMGIVRLARQPGIGRDVAVKTLREIADTPAARRRLLNEARVTGTLEHPNVVPVYAVGRDEAGRPFLVMRRIGGETWSSAIADERDRGATEPTDRQLRVLVQICNVMGFAHERGVLHRDLKPDNVMIGSWGEVYVLDWGLAVALTPGAVPGLPTAAAQRRVSGTPAYMAPEQALGDPLTVATDVWLLGALLYELAHGHGPHLTGDAEADTVSRTLARAAAVIPPLSPDLPPALASLLLGALDRNPQRRFPSAQSFRDAVQRFMDERSARALAARAFADLERLEALAAQLDAEGEVYALLGSSRFGFQQVLERVPGDVDARDALDRALCAGAAWHLGRGEWQAAEALLVDVRVSPARLVALVHQGRLQSVARDARLAHLEDTRTGVRTRAFVIAIMGVLWVLSPVTYGVLRRGEIGGYGEGLGFALAFGLLGLGLGYWARDSLSKSALNARIRWLLVSPAAVLLLNTAGCWLLDVDPKIALVLLLLPYAAVSVNYATFDRRFVVPAITYVVAFLASAAAPSCALAWLSFGNAVVTLTILLMGARHLGEGLAEDIEGAVNRRLAHHRNPPEKP